MRENEQLRLKTEDLDKEYQSKMPRNSKAEKEGESRDTH